MNTSTNARREKPRTNRRQGVFWMATIPEGDWQPPNDLPREISWIRGQLEVGAGSGYRHWQLLFAFAQKKSLNQAKEIIGPSAHLELSRSEAAGDYVWKEDTRVEGTQFELGAKPIRRNSRVDWESVWTAAKSGLLENIPPNIRVVNYRTLQVK